jgi:hypothetical protein
VSFYLQLEMANGQKHAVNLNGEPYNNFLIPHAALLGSLPSPRRVVAQHKDPVPDLN